MSLAKVMAPAIKLPEEGVPGGQRTVARARHRRLAALRRSPERRWFFPGGKALAPGARLVQKDLARTLRLIAASGPKAFYEGPIADSLVAEEKRGGGIITKEDLKRYKPEWRTPIKSTYRGYTLFTMPPASSGGITMTETLNILENFAPLPAGSAKYVHLLSESVSAGVHGSQLEARRSGVREGSARPAHEQGVREDARGADRPETCVEDAGLRNRRPKGAPTHYSVVDAMGNAVATTTTLNGGYGSGVWIRGGGFFMNNEMDDFAAQPGTPNMFGLVQGEANAIEPGKRMLSAMAPTIVLDPQGSLLLVTGAAGGPTIITATMEVILNVIEQHMTLADAMRAPRLHHQALPDQDETTRFSGAVVDSLGRIAGHAIRAQNKDRECELRSCGCRGMARGYRRPPVVGATSALPPTATTTGRMPPDLLQGDYRGPARGTTGAALGRIP